MEFSTKMGGQNSRENYRSKGSKQAVMLYQTMEIMVHVYVLCFKLDVEIYNQFKAKVYKNYLTLQSSIEKN